MPSRRGFIRGAAMGIGTLAALAGKAADAPANAALSLNVIYPSHDGARFDTNYYRTKHIPLAMKIMKADRVLLIEGVPNGAAPAPYAMICHFEFASSEALQAALANAAMAEVRADVANFTDIKPTVMLGRPA